MSYGNKPRYDYNNPSRSNEEELVEKLDPEKLDEFKAFLTDLDDKIKIQFGPPGRTERLRFEKINDFIADMGESKVLAMVMYQDNNTKNLINYTKVNSKEKSGEDALAEIKLVFGDKLKLPWMRRMNLFDYPFEVEYKKTPESKMLQLTMDFRKTNTLAKYRLIIRSSNLLKIERSREEDTENP